jgi:tetratricopeptide (TPR) repeat protein
MRFRKRSLVATLLVLAALALALPGLAQYREYNISGRVVDTQKKPLDRVEITLRDRATSRSYSLRTKKDGTFKFVGLPHGVYQVVFEKAGFAVKLDEWKFEQPQDTMMKVEIPDIVLAAQEVIQEAQRMKEAAGEVKAAAELVRQGNYDEALAKLKPILEKNPKDTNALYLTGMSYLKKQMWAEAIPPLLYVTELSPKFAPAHYQLGVCYEQQKDPEKALGYFRKAMELDPNNPDSPFKAGMILFGQSHIDEALGFFETTLGLKPDDPGALEMAGRCYINKIVVTRPDGRAEINKDAVAKAIEYLEKAKAAYTNDPDRVKFLDDLVVKLKEQLKK